jgi:hypothetical protein
MGGVESPDATAPMEAFMKTLCSVMALTIALAMASTSFSSAAEAQGKQTTVRKAKAKQKPGQRRTRAVAQPRAVEKPCVRYTWFGCVGWDPDPNVRDMLAREVGDDDG